MAFQLTPERASIFARIALGHVERQYPHKLDHVLLSEADCLEPRALHPIFFGSFDWHSCVHGYWLLARLRRRFPDGSEALRIEALFNQAFTDEHVARETAYLSRPMSGGFERPYGWAWLLTLDGELARHSDAAGQRWSKALKPLAAAFVERFLSFLPKATYPLRAGVHTSTAFALHLASAYARSAGEHTLQAMLVSKLEGWHLNDVDAQAWEPSGDEFLSPTLMEATAMAGVLDPDAFALWFDRFLPRLAQKRPGSIFAPATVSDRSDGKIAHLDGLNLSRAWCFRALADAVRLNDPRRSILLQAAEDHLAAGLDHLSGDYAGEHWLASFALLALDGL